MDWTREARAREELRESQEPFYMVDFLALVQIFDDHDPEHDRSPVTFHEKDGKLLVRIDDSDLFDWGYSGDLPLSPRELPELRKAFEDIAAVTEYTTREDAGKLFLCRRAGRRPQGAQYRGLAREAWPLFDACGPWTQEYRGHHSDPEPEPPEDPA